MIRKAILYAFLILVLTLFISCPGLFDKPKQDSVSNIGYNTIFYDRDENEVRGKYVKLRINTLNALMEDSRTIIPSNPSLYFTITGSTKFTDTNGNGVLDKNESADCTYAASYASGESVLIPNFGSVPNKMQSLSMIFKVGESYYLTAYGTSQNPSIDNNSYDGSPSPKNIAFIYGHNFSNDGIYTDYSAALKNTNDLKTIAGVSSLTNSQVYCAAREKIVENLEAEAIIKGTIQIYVGENNGNIKLYLGNDASGQEINTICIETSADNCSGNGHALIPVYIPATASLPKNLQVETVRYKWTSKLDSSYGFAEFIIIPTNRNADQNMAFYLTIPSGTYDTDLILLNEDGNDVFTIHDTLNVWKNKISYLYGNSSYYNNAVASWTDTFVGSDIPNAVTHKEAVVSGGNSTPSAWTATELYDSDRLSSGTVITGYNISTANITDNFRTIFYVSGSGGVLPADTSGSPDGSLFHPFKKIQDAVDAIYDSVNNARPGTDSTDWNIVVDGAPDVSSGVYLINRVDKGFNLTIRKFAAAKVLITNENVTFINNTSDNNAYPFNVWLKDVIWYKDSYNEFKFIAGTDIYLLDTTVAKRTSDGQEGGAVEVYKNHESGGVSDSADGTFYSSVSDTSVVLGIKITDGTTYVTGSPVIDYRYRSPNSVYNETPAVTYIGQDFSSRFVLGNAFAANHPAVRLSSDSVVGNTSYGCIVLE